MILPWINIFVIPIFVFYHLPLTCFLLKFIIQHQLIFLWDWTGRYGQRSFLMPVGDTLVSSSDARHAPAFTTSTVWGLFLLSFLQLISVGPYMGRGTLLKDAWYRGIPFVDSLFTRCF